MERGQATITLLSAGWIVRGKGSREAYSTTAEQERKRGQQGLRCFSPAVQQYALLIVLLGNWAMAMHPRVIIKLVNESGKEAIRVDDERLGVFWPALVSLGEMYVTTNFLSRMGCRSKADQPAFGPSVCLGCMGAVLYNEHRCCTACQVDLYS